MSTPPRGAILCMSRYGATRQYAGWLANKLQLPVIDPEKEFVRLMSYDYFLIGSPVYIGKMLIAKWLENHKEELAGKKLFFFIVCATQESDESQCRKIVEDNIPRQLISSENINILPGRLIIRHLSWRDRMLLRIGSILEKDPDKKKGMRKDFDQVDARYLADLLKKVMQYSEPAVPA